MSLELASQLSNVEPGGHLCLFYEKDPGEQMPALLPFVREGLTRDEQFIYIADDQTVEQLALHLENGGIDVGAETKAGRLKLYTRNEWRQPGDLDSSRKAGQVREFIAQAARAGFKGIRFAVEMTWTLGPSIDAAKLEHWEATINTLFEPSFPARIICQYNRSRLDPEALIAALHTHPRAIIGKTVYPNPFFEAPLILSGNGPAHSCNHPHGGQNENCHAARARLDWMLSQLRQAREAEQYRIEADMLRSNNLQLTQAEEALKNSREHLRAIIDTTPECVKIIAPDGTLLDINAAGCRMVAVKHPSHIVGKSIYEIIAPEDRARFQGMNERVCAGESETLAFQIISLDGARHFMETHAAPLRDPRTGKFNQLAITRDVTAQKSAQDAWRYLAAIVESSDDAIVTKNLDGIITSWNQGAERLFGYTAAEAVGKSVTMLIPADRQNEEPGILARLHMGQRVDHYETIRRRKDGTLLDISLTISPVRDAHGSIIGASKIARDITHRKRTEEALRESEGRFRALIDNSFLPIWVKNCDGAYIMVNRRYEEIFGLREQDMYGKTDFDFFPPDLARKFRQNDLEVIRAGKPIEIEEIAPQKDGPHTYISVKFPLRKSDGIIHAIAGIAMDITGRKRVEIELNQARERLVRVNEDLEKSVQERTASLREVIAQMEEFSYSVSHDLRAPVRAMKGYAQAALEDYGERLDERGRDFLDRIVRSGARMERLIHDVLTYSRLARSEMQLQPVSLQGLIPEIIQQYPALQPAQAEITIRGPLHPVIAQEALLTQALSNLLSNAVKFVAPGTRPRLLIWTEPRTEGHIRLSIQDNGIGIPPEYQTRLFGMFERIHQENHYDGNGIGLAIVRKAVEKMGGRVGVESDGLVGSNFWIELRAAKTP